MDFTKTLTLLAAIEKTNPVTTFLRDRYFPSNANVDVFNTDEVLVEYKDGNKKIAPFVSPRKNGRVIMRDGYAIESYAPANIAPKRALYIDDITKKGFGEALFSNLTPEQRQGALIMKDIKDMTEMIKRREEAMAAETMISNGCVMKHYADKGDEYEEKEIHFYSGEVNPAVYTPSMDWSNSQADILGDMYQMAYFLMKDGNAATEILVGSNVVDAILNNDAIYKQLDNKRFEVGMVAPVELPNGVTRIAQLLVKGHPIDVITYPATYENEDGEDTPFIPKNKVIMSAPGAGHTSYGAVTQLEQSDGQMHTYPGMLVPHYVADANNNSRSITLTSRPLLMPKTKNPWISADVIS